MPWSRYSVCGLHGAQCALDYRSHRLTASKYSIRGYSQDEPYLQSLKYINYLLNI